MTFWSATPGMCGFCSCVLAFTIGTLGAIGCRQAHRHDDARAITIAYRSFLEASESERESALRSLKSVRCNDADTCSARDACAIYATDLVASANLRRRAKELAPEDAGGNGAATPAELSIIVAGATDAMQRANQEVGGCLAAIDRLYATIAAD
ncbi:MAG: hypothetical protein NVS3B20_14300 [Polyangiales bacterium]